MLWQMRWASNRILIVPILRPIASNGCMNKTAGHQLMLGADVLPESKRVQAAVRRDPRGTGSVPRTTLLGRYSAELQRPCLLQYSNTEIGV